MFALVLPNFQSMYESEFIKLSAAVSPTRVAWRATFGLDFHC